jgi:hypothetical protein
MNTYTVHFASDAEIASHDFDAETPEQALALARKLYENDPSELWFETYDSMDVNEIIVYGAGGNQLAVWHDDDMRLRLAARDLLDAAELVVARWERGDLAEAVRGLDAAIAKAKGGDA